MNQDLNEQMWIDAHNAALQAVIAMDLPEQIIISSTSFEGLGIGLNRIAKQALEVLMERHGENLPCLVGISVKLLWHTAYKAAFLAPFRIAARKTVKRSQLVLGVPEGDIATCGWANLLSDEITFLEAFSLQAYLNGTPFVEKFSPPDCMECAALYWFSKAADLMRDGKILEAIELIVEGCDALSWVEGFHTFDGGVEHEVEANSELTKAALAKAGAKGGESRHALSNELKNWAVMEGKKLKGHPADKARELMQRLPPDIEKKLEKAGDKFKDPERVVREALARQRNKPNTFS